MLRAVIDTNVWVSALLNPKGYPALVLDAFRHGRFEPILSSPLIDELIDVLSRPRVVKKYEISTDEAAAYAALIIERSKVVSLPGILQLCRDPRDDAVLETALVGRADCLVSRDDDVKRDEELIKEMDRQGVSVLSVARFLVRLKEA